MTALAPTLARTHAFEAILFARRLSSSTTAQQTFHNAAAHAAAVSSALLAMDDELFEARAREWAHAHVLLVGRSRMAGRLAGPVVFEVAS